MEQSINEKAEKKKQLGNAEFKKQNYSAAINYYTDAIEIQPHEAIYSNRAASLIALKDFKRALDDCQAAIRLNAEFAKIYKRLFRAHLGLGEVQEAK